MSVSGDDPAHCAICGKETSIAMIARHLVVEHGIDPQELANAPVIDKTQQPTSNEASRLLEAMLEETVGPPAIVRIGNDYLLGTAWAQIETPEGRFMIRVEPL